MVPSAERNVMQKINKRTERNCPSFIYKEDDENYAVQISPSSASSTGGHRPIVNGAPSSKTNKI